MQPDIHTFGDSWSMNEKNIKPGKLILAGKRIGVFGKGGSGKSTAVVLLAKDLRKHGYDVCILDADSTNIGLSLALGIEESPEPLIDYFGGMVFSGGKVTCPVDDPTPLDGNEISLEKLPPQYYRQNHEEITLLVAGKIGNQGPGAGCDGPISKIARDIRINQMKATPITLIDLKAGFEDSARGVITSLDWAIVLVDATFAAIEMAINMRDMVNQIKNGVLPATQHLETHDLVEIANKLYAESRIKGALFLLNKIRNSDMENYMRTKLAEGGIEPDGIIHEDPSISISWLKGIALDPKKTQADILGFKEKLEDAERQYTH
jgi:CO dehydrogenase nickel-insertion accessory protein CooC1